MLILWDLLAVRYLGSIWWKPQPPVYDPDLHLFFHRLQPHVVSSWFNCCGNSCCQEYQPEQFQLFSGPLRIFVIVFLIIIPPLCTCGLAERFFHNCRKSGQDPPADHEGPPKRPPITPAERVTASICEPPPPYSKIILKTVMGLPPVEPPPPYSFRPEEHAGVRSLVTFKKVLLVAVDLPFCLQGLSGGLGSAGKAVRQGAGGRREEGGGERSPAAVQSWEEG
ncbi:transmembrane protein [Pontoporia blainvillei]|uniref:Transmembrane protein n=1 Tax=Pontoporia blainvillei TaxID=48723 RepID=A0ABX0S3G3_PONBL|nr:transmembrane protein [Pontoporia blainvillei]